MSYKDNIRNFYIEYLQGEDPEWLLRKYGFDALLQVNEEGEVYSVNQDGRNLIKKILDLDPTDIVKARFDQRDNPEGFPWRLKSPSKTAKNTID